EASLLRSRIFRRMGDYAGFHRQIELARRFDADIQRIELETTLADAQIRSAEDTEAKLIALLNHPGRNGADVCDTYTNTLARQGRLAETQTLINAWRKDFPQDPKPCLKLARIAEHELNYQKAESEYRSAIAISPRYAPALYSLARLLLDRKQPEEALGLFLRCADIDQRLQVPCNIGEAKCLIMLGQPERAETVLISIANTDTKALAVAFQQIGFPLEGNPIAYELGKLKSNKGDFEEAETLLQRAVSANPFDLDARYALAIAQRGSGKVELANQQFEHVAFTRKELAKTESMRSHLATHPDDVETRFQIGEIYLKYQSPRLGIYWLQSVLSIDPSHTATHRTLASYYFQHVDDYPTYRDLGRYHEHLAGGAAIAAD
ncbi:MAG: tetratricopeptide repeat protein, partial [Pirellulaceae bacterium]